MIGGGTFVDECCVAVPGRCGAKGLSRAGVAVWVLESSLQSFHVLLLGKAARRPPPAPATAGDTCR